jgi:outer membrane receptor protein involved in Fe transport
VDVTWFDNRYKNIIGLETIDFTTFRVAVLQHRPDARRGAELSGDVALVSGFRIKAGYTFTDSRILESTSAFSEVLKAGNRPAPPPSAGFTTSRGSAAARRSVSSGRSSASDPTATSPRSSGDHRQRRLRVWDVRASVPAGRRLTLTAAIDNLFDSDHMEPLGYPVLGRAARVGIARASEPVIACDGPPGRA